MDNTFLDLQNSSYHSQPHSIIDKCYSNERTSFSYWLSYSPPFLLQTVSHKRSVSLRFQRVFENVLLQEFILKQWPISEFTKAFSSKRGLVHNHSFENEFNLQVNEISFPYKRTSTNWRLALIKRPFGELGNGLFNHLFSISIGDGWLRQQPCHLSRSRNLELLI